MVEVPTKTCDKCQDEFDIDEIYKECTIVTHEHPEDVEVGNTWEDEHFTLCGPCSVDLAAWFEPDVDSGEELMSKLAEDTWISKLP